MVPILSVFPGKAIPFFAKFNSAPYVDDYASAYRHDAFVQNRIGAQYPQILLTGSCQLLSVWCTEKETSRKCTIAYQLEKEFKRHDHPTVVHNLSLHDHMAGHNLRTFLYFLEDPQFNTFIWHDEPLDSVISISIYEKKDLNSYVPYIYRRLRELQTQFPDIEEIPLSFPRNFEQC
jgi:hypothetical protein